jgi:RNA polymerase sigma-70 factor (ECF subfamily)
MTEEELPDWNRIVERHGKRVFRVAFRILGSVQDAEDVAQDAFVEAFRLHKAGPVQSWTGLLVRIATLRAIDRLRRTRRPNELGESAKAVTAEPFEEAIATELAERLQKAVADLPDQQATIFVMIYYEELSRDEVAAGLGISTEAVSAGLYKARQRLTSQFSVFSKGVSP